MRTIHVSDYDSRWPSFFEQIRSTLWPAVQDLAIKIEHVGSTSVPGLAAKPIIDIDIIIPPYQDIELIAARLHPLGYLHVGNLGIAGREAFRYENTLPPHNLYVCPADSIGLRNHLAVRDYLRAHPDAARAYSELKHNLAAAFTHDITRYVDGKTDFILSILRQSNLSQEEVTAIEQANRLI